MTVPEKIWQYCIVDSLNRCLYLNGGIVQRMSIGAFTGTGFSPFLPQNPKGWLDLQISFGTNVKYWNLNRSFSIPMYFVGDGAVICRNAMYAGKGYEEELYIVILKWNPGTGIYELEYRGRLDFSKAIDEARKGVTVNAIEGGVLSYLTANDGVSYPTQCNTTNPDAKIINFDGVNLFDRYRYSLVEFDQTGNGGPSIGDMYTLPFPFISNEGDSVGIIQGTQTYDQFNSHVPPFNQATANAYAASSVNYSFSSTNSVSLKITGTISYAVDMNGILVKQYLFFQTSLGNFYPLFGTGGAPVVYTGDATETVTINTTINLAPNEKLFLMAYTEFDGISFSHVTYVTSDIFYEFVSRNSSSTAYCLEPLDLLKSIVSQMTEGRFTAGSVFFSQNKNLVMTSTNAIRQFTDAVVDMTFQDWFNDYDAEKNLAIKIVNNVLFVEPKELIYDDDAEILDIGEIADLKFNFADDLLCNTATFGYKTQDYRQRNGKYEFNTTTSFKLPVNTVKKDYTKVLKSRGDSLGIEFVRELIFDKPTTDTTGDNQPFMVNVKNAQDDVVATVGFLNAGNEIFIPNGIRVAVGDVINFTGSVNNDGVRTVIGVGSLLFFGQVLVVTGGAPLVDEPGVSVFMQFVMSKYRTEKRLNYDTIVGVLDNTVYNIEEMTPHRMMYAHGSVLKSLMFQIPDGVITLQKSDKNADLSTSIAGVTIAEKQPETVSNLPGDMLFYPIYGKFTTVVPMSFAKIFSSLGTGYIKGTYLGTELYFLPIGKMDGKPASNAAQSWELLLAPKNDIAVIKDLSLEGIFTTDVMGNTIFTSDLNGLHFNKYNYVPASKYQHKDMYDDWFNNRKDGFISGSMYSQKWQTSDFTPIQCITKGLGIVQVDVYTIVQDSANQFRGVLYSTTPMTITADPAVRLPYIRQDYLLSFATMPEGQYFVVLSNGDTTKYRISEPFDLRVNHDNTVLYEYWHTTNKYSTYFTDANPMLLRVEGMLLPWYPDGTFEAYTDEIADNELLDGIPTQKRIMRIKPIPDWLANKIFKILFLNRTYIEGIRYSRTTDSKFDKKEYPGHDMKSYSVEISRAKNYNGLGTTEDGSTEADQILIAWTIDAQAFGQGDPGDIIDIELPLEP